MIKVSIIRDGKITNEASFPTREEADQWLGYHESAGSFGQPATYDYYEVEVEPAVYGPKQVLIKEAVYNSDGDELEPALYAIDGEELIKPAVYRKERRLVMASSYEVVITDETAKLEQEKINTEALAFLAATDCMVLRAMERGEELSEEFKQERDAARARIVKG